MSCGVRVPEHDLVEVDGLGFRAPVAVDAEARLGVDEGDAVAARAVLGIAHRTAVGPAELSIEPDIDTSTLIVRRMQPHIHGDPRLPRNAVGHADLPAFDSRR